MSGAAIRAASPRTCATGSRPKSPGFPRRPRRNAPPPKCAGEDRVARNEARPRRVFPTPNHPAIASAKSVLWIPAGGPATTRNARSAQAKASHGDETRQGERGRPRRENSFSFNGSFDPRFVHKHHGDVVTNRIHAAALGALEPLLVRSQFNWCLVQRTNEDIEQLLGNSHSFLRPRL